MTNTKAQVKRMKNMLMWFDLGVNTRPMSPLKLLPGFCWSRFQVGAAQQGFSFKTCYYPIVGTWGLLAHWFLELRFALLSALSQQLCAAPKYLLRHGFIGSLSSFVDRIEMHTWMQMEGFPSETWTDSILWSCATYGKYVIWLIILWRIWEKSPFVACYCGWSPRGKDPSSWSWRDARLRTW